MMALSTGVSRLLQRTYAGKPLEARARAVEQPSGFGLSEQTRVLLRQAEIRRADAAISQAREAGFQAMFKPTFTARVEDVLPGKLESMGFEMDETSRRRLLRRSGFIVQHAVGWVDHSSPPYYLNVVVRVELSRYLQDENGEPTQNHIFDRVRTVVDNELQTCSVVLRDGRGFWKHAMMQATNELASRLSMEYQSDMQPVVQFMIAGKEYVNQVPETVVFE